jgi:hypothetical protein
MLLPNSSTSNSEPPEPRSRFLVAPGAIAKLGRTAGFFLLFLALFEVLIWAVFTRTPLANSSIRQYLWYGVSYEAKLRQMVNTPNLPSNSLLYAGWLGDGKLQSLPRDTDLTVYGMSFSANLANAIEELRPKLSQRLVGGPGAPLSHTYAIYQVDKQLRKTRFAVIGVTSGAVQEVVLMNRGTLYSDSPFPYFFPRYKLDHGQLTLAANSLINSPAELRTALDTPELWQRQLAVLAANDAAYHRFFFAKDFLDNSAIGRLVRRGMSKRYLEAYSHSVLGPDGFRLDQEAPQLFRTLLRQMAQELRAENVQPIVVLFSLQGHADYLHDLVADILRDDAIPYVDSNDFCRSNDSGNYLADLHFNHQCDLKFAQRTLELIDAADKRRSGGE